ncbi:MAG: gamma carbonic anhydrase family protein [Acidobacteria bacterium RIFCSPLOWO2_12_FULL_54_10]|nr:MAG: gamma carbonic anhydrase family protein [Acidobacteria bacterium RIFCSPLOWO2_12_FULL_54_10]
MIRTYNGILPSIAPTAFIDDSAQIIGDVVIGEHCSVWPNVVIRGDVNFIRIGDETNIQDNSVLHVETDQYSLIIEDRITVGHSVVLHGCRIGRGSLIGIGAIVLNGADIGAGSLIGAGAVVPERAIIPPGSLVLGVPGKVRRTVTPEEIQRMERNIAGYLRLKDQYKKEQR